MTLEKWNAFFANTFAQHAVTRRLKADRWLRSQLYSLRRGCGVVELSHEQLEDVAKTYGMVSKLIQDDGFVYKEELVNANGGDASLVQGMEVASRSGDRARRLLVELHRLGQ